MTRDELLRVFNERFYIWLPKLAEHNLFQTPIVGDVHEGIAKALEHFALYDIENRKRDTISTLYTVGLNPIGADWVIMPIGPAWRLCSSVVQEIVEAALIAKQGSWVKPFLYEGDVASFEAARVDA